MAVKVVNVPFQSRHFTIAGLTTDPSQILAPILALESVQTVNYALPIGKAGSGQV